MPRTNRIDIANIPCHIINRANARVQIFDTPKDYIDLINIQENEKEKEELESLRYSVNKGKPYGSNDWTNRMINRFNLGSTLRGAGDQLIAPDPIIHLTPLFTLRR